MPVHKVKGGKGYQFGTHGKVYSTKEQVATKNRKRKLKRNKSWKNIGKNQL